MLQVYEKIYFDKTFNDSEYHTHILYAKQHLEKILKFVTLFHQQNVYTLHIMNKFYIYIFRDEMISSTINRNLDY